MQVYLPIAEMPVDPVMVAVMGGAVGFVSGMFGVSGGFLMTPLLIFYGVPPAVAVGTETAQIVASSVSGLSAHLRRKAVDFQMGGLLIAGGVAGSIIGVFLFKYLRASGLAETFVTVAYFLFLGVIGALMLLESLNAILRQPRAGARKRRKRRVAWMAALPMPMRFRRSQLYISPIPPIVLGFLVGLLGALLGVGGGFIMVPAMIYILNMPSNVVVGTSLFQITVVTAVTTVLHAAANQTVDVVLALLLTAGGVLGAQAGVRVGVLLKAEQLRALLALVVLAVAIRLGFDLVLPPAEPFVVEAL